MFASGIPFDALLDPTGLERASRGNSERPSFGIESWFNPLAVALQAKHVEQSLRSFSADILVTSQLALGPLLVGERRHLPIGVMGLSTYPWPVALQSPVLEETPLHQRRKWRLQDMQRYYQQARIVTRWPSSSSLMDENPFLGDLFLLRSVPELEQDAERLPAPVHMIGDYLWEPDQVDEELERWLDEATSRDELVVYVQHGRSFHTPSFWPALVEATASLPVRIAASLGRMDERPGPLPKNFFVRPHVQQSTVLRRAAAAVASANSTVVLGALVAGIPLVLVPGGGEQPDVAERCVAAGVGVALSPEGLTATQLASVLCCVLDSPSFRHNARRVAKSFRTLRETDSAPLLIESLAAPAQLQRVMGGSPQKASSPEA